MWQPRAFQYTSSATGKPHKVHIVFGFHVNLYHSFRGDTNDENGFGKDIRIIRHTIDTLDRFNAEGIPVSAVWDFDNLFSLEERLPAHAPDIIRDVKRRVEENGDEVILMSYNNGLASAMNHEEFMASVQRAISNEKGSGVRDLFGRFAPVVRPQEMMTTPGNFERYRQSGVEYVSLYYSATPFDAFRVFSRELTPTESYNPVQYRHPESGEEIVVIPTYHAGDLVEHVSLRNWAEKLHRLQNEGAIDRDALIFINFDADAEFWTGAKLPWHLRMLPNTGGITQLVESIADLDFVSLGNLSDYLADHPPVGTIHFNQDTADGSFHGYSSWAEKKGVSDTWTSIVRNRRAHWMARKIHALGGSQGMPAMDEELLQRSFETRLRALSTTNFGLASPFLAREREAAVASLTADLDRNTEHIHAQIDERVRALIGKAPPLRVSPHHGEVLETFLHLESDTAGDRYVALALPAKDTLGYRYQLADCKGRIIPTTVTQKDLHKDGGSATLTLHIASKHAMPDGLYALLRQKDEPGLNTEKERQLFADAHTLQNEFLRVQFGEDGSIKGVAQGDTAQLDPKSLLPYFRYRGRKIHPQGLAVSVVENGQNGVAAVRIHGRWDGPPGMTRAPGWVDYRLQLIKGCPYLIVSGKVRYPDTWRRDVIQAEKPMLARKVDTGWEEVAPLELRFSARARKSRPFYIHKRNFLGEESAYAVDYFRHSPKNLDVANINNHVTPEYTAVTTAGRGMAVAMNTEKNANFAFCPYKMEYLPDAEEFAILANPFGTYSGEQMVPPTRGNGLGYEAVLLSGPQFNAAGPTYNGQQDQFEVLVAFFKGDTIPAKTKQDLIAFARRPIALGRKRVNTNQQDSPALLPPDGLLALPYGNGILFHWEAAASPGVRYRIHYRTLPIPEENTVTVTGSTRLVPASDLPENIGFFSASMDAIYPDGRISPRSMEINFRLNQEASRALDIPNDFKAKIIWANLHAWIRKGL